MLRQTMLFSGLEVCAHNINRKQKDLKLFEFGKDLFNNFWLPMAKNILKKNGLHFSSREILKRKTGSTKPER